MRPVHPAAGEPLTVPHFSRHHQREEPELPPMQGRSSYHDAGAVEERPELEPVSQFLERPQANSVRGRETSRAAAVGGEQHGDQERKTQLHLTEVQRSQKIPGLFGGACYRVIIVIDN